MIFNERRTERIKKGLTQKPFVFYFIGVFMIYIIINIFTNQLHVSLDVLSGFALWFIIPFLLFNFLIIPFLVGLTVSLSVLRFKEAGSLFGKAGGTGAFGVFGGIIGGACPGCFVGLFPAILGLFGVTATLSVLPLFGLEIQFLSAAFLITAIILLTRDTVCKVPIK